MEDENQRGDTEKSGKWWLRKVAPVKDLRSNVNANVQQGKSALIEAGGPQTFRGHLWLPLQGWRLCPHKTKICLAPQRSRYCLKAPVSFRGFTCVLLGHKGEPALYYQRPTS